MTHLPPLLHFAVLPSLPPPSPPQQAFYSQRWSPSEAEDTPATAAKGTTAAAAAETPPTAPHWRLRYSLRLRDAAALGAPRKPFADLLPGGHRGPVRAAALASGVLSTGGADRRIRLWDLRRCSGDERGRPRAELIAASAPLPGSVRCVASGCGMLVSGSGVDARLAVWRRRGSGEGEGRREEEEEEEEEEEDFDDDDDDSDRSLSSFSSSAGGDDGREEDDDEASASRRLCSATLGLRLQESNRRRRTSRQASAAAAAAADTDHNRRPPPLPPFDLSAPPVFLSGHAGPVAAVSVEEGLIYSASWDTTVRVWDPDRRREEEGEEQERAGGQGAAAEGNGGGGAAPHCVGVVHLRDWGWSVQRRAGRLLVAEGRGAAAFDAETGKALLRVAPSEADGGRRGDAARVEGTRDGRTLLVARADGSLESVDLRSAAAGAGAGRGERRGSSGTTALLLPGGPPPSGLALSDPWVALASGRGGVALLDARRPRAPLAAFSAAAAAAAASARGKGRASAAAAAPGAAAAKPASLPIPRPPRRLGWSSNAAVRCVEISGTWVVAGCDDGSVRSWWFGGGGGEGGGQGGCRRRSRGGRGRGRGRGGET